MAWRERASSCSRTSWNTCPTILRCFSSILAALRPGACLLLTVPAHLALWSQHDESFGHYRRYDQRRFEQLWQGLPARAEMVSYYNSHLYGIVKLVRGWNRWTGKASGHAGTDFRVPPPPLNQLLRWTMTRESRRLLRLVRGERATPFRSGVSLMALVRREPGACVVRGKPAGTAADYFDPQGQRASALSRPSKLASLDCPSPAFRLGAPPVATRWALASNHATMSVVAAARRLKSDRARKRLLATANLGTRRFPDPASGLPVGAKK